MVGDLNADLPDNSSMFAKHMLHFCVDNNFKISSKMLLPKDSYTYISEAWHTTSWLDHCISTTEAHDIIKSMTILYGESISDHVPFLMLIDFESLPKINYECKRAVLVKVDWSKITDEDLETYYGKTDTLLNKVVLPRDASCVQM